MQSSSLPNFPDWLPAAVREEAQELWEKIPTEKDPAKAQKVLEQLAANPLMKRVWAELYRKKLDGNKFFNPACLTPASKAAAYREEARVLQMKGGEANRHNAKLLQLEARFMELFLADEQPHPDCNEQDYAVSLFFARAYRAAFKEPQMTADAKSMADKLRGVAKQLQKIATDLNSMGGMSGIYAEKVIAIAKDCESDATVTEPNRTASPWLVDRKRGDIERRTYAAHLFAAADEIFGRPLYSTIANVTNVVFSAQTSGDHRPANSITASTVREMLRNHSRPICPSFGHLLYQRRQVPEAELDNALQSEEH